MTARPSIVGQLAALTLEHVLVHERMRIVACFWRVSFVGVGVGFVFLIYGRGLSAAEPAQEMRGV